MYTSLCMERGEIQENENWSSLSTMTAACLNVIRYSDTSTLINLTTQQTRDIDPMMDQCWASVVDGGTTLVQHWVDFSWFAGYFFKWR